MRNLLLTGALALVAVTTACASDEIGAPETAVDELMTVESQFGEVEVPSEPRAALGMYTTDIDILIALDIPLADAQPIRGDGWTTFPAFFPEEPLEGIEPFANYPDYDFDAILEAQPDFILNGLGYDKLVNRRLPTIAPTYSVDAFDGRSWLEHFKETAEALDRVEQYDAWMEKYEARVTEVRAAIEDAGMEDVVVAPLGYWEGDMTSSCYSGVECQAFEDLGLEVFAGATKDGGEGVTFSSEQVGQLADIDYSFVPVIPTDSGAEEYETVLEEAGKNPLWSRLPMVENEQIVSYDLEITYGSPSGQLAFLDVIEETLTGDQT